MFHRYEYTYERYGRKTSESYFGRDGEPVWKKGSGQKASIGIEEVIVGDIPPERRTHRREWEYDEQGLLVEERTYNVDGDLISVKEKGD